MEGYYEENMDGAKSHKGCLRIDVETNLQEFNNLLQKASEQTEQLEKTLRELRWFQLNIEVSTPNGEKSEEDGGE